MSSTKTAIYSNHTTYSLILKRGTGKNLCIFEKKRKGKELTNWHGENRL
jgi:hypothetical protein